MTLGKKNVTLSAAVKVTDKGDTVIKKVFYQTNVDKVCLIFDADSESHDLEHFDRLYEIVIHDFPWVIRKNVDTARIERSPSTSHGVKFQVPDGIPVPADYAQWY